MQKIKIKIYNVGPGDLWQPNIKIFNNCHKLIYEGKTCGGTLKLNLEENNIYYLSASLNGDVLKQAFYVSKNNQNYCFKLPNSIMNSNNTSEGEIITFLMTDFNYNNLPIERGVLILNG